MRVEIDKKKRIARFSGPGTYEFKDEIKLLGRARWRRDLKTWEVVGFDLAVEDIEIRFPGIDIHIVDEHDESGGVQGTVTVAETASSARLTDAQPSFDGSAAAQIGPDVPVSNGVSVPKGLSVLQLSGLVRELLHRSMPDPLPVYGIIKSARRSGDRMFIELAQHDNPTQSINCVIWNDVDRVTAGLTRAGFKLEPDLQVMFEVRVSLNVKDGRVSLRVISIVAEYTLAKLQGERERTNERLRVEGLFARNKDRKLPFLPRKLGVLTSSAGTVIRDFTTTLDTASFGFELLWFPVRVQGAEARASILRGFQVLQSIPDLDAILLFRGGGSKADLAIFNDYEVARTICMCPLPVIAAIGHEEDQSSAQDVAAISLGVPAKVGQLFADIVIDLRRRMADAARKIQNAARERSGRATDRTSFLLRSICGGPSQRLAAAERDIARLGANVPCMADAVLKRADERMQSSTRTIRSGAQTEYDRASVAIRTRLSAIGSGGRALVEGRRALLPQLRARLLGTIGERIGRARDRLRNETERTSATIDKHLRVAETRLEGLERLMEEARPERQLARGFTLVRDADGAYVRDGRALDVGVDIEIQFSDAPRFARIIR